MFRVIVAGSRDFIDSGVCFEVLDKVFSKKMPDSVVCGKARGADTLGAMWAVKHGVKVDEFPADWNRYGKSAGYLRNAEMADNAEALVAFWDGTSRGTRHMINLAVEHGLQVIVFNYLSKKFFKYQ